MEFPIEVVKVGTLFGYFKQHPLDMNMEVLVFTSFDGQK